jgi:TrmH family RNA methyltransferase
MHALREYLILFNLILFNKFYLWPVAELTKAQIKHIQAFAEKKYRNDKKAFIAEGSKIIEDLIRLGCKPLEIYCTENNLLNEAIVIPRFEMQKISQLHTASNALAVFQIPSFSEPIIDNKVSLILDGIQDPGNMGTIIRTAHWFGIENIFCSLNCADVYAPKVIQASMASIAAVHIYRQELLPIIKKNLHIHSYAATLQGKALKTFSPISQGLIILGSEGTGISKEILQACTHTIKIESFSNAESLNVAVAAGIICNALIA